MNTKISLLSIITIIIACLAVPTSVIAGNDNGLTKEQRQARIEKCKEATGDKKEQCMQWRSEHKADNGLTKEQRQARMEKCKEATGDKKEQCMQWRSEHKQNMQNEHE